MPPRKSQRLSVGAYLIDALRKRGVNHVFGVPGDFILGLYEIGSERGMDMVNSTREEAATYAADGYAREKGLGAVAVTYGVGMVATMAALGGANNEMVPVVVIGGAPGMGERDGRRIHHSVSDDLDAPRLMSDHLTSHSMLLDNADTAYAEIDWILDHCMHELRPVFIELPRDLISAVPTQVYSPSYTTPRTISIPERTNACADDLVATIRAARRPIINVGNEVVKRRLGTRVLALAKKMNIPVVETVMGKGGVNEDETSLTLGVYSGAGTIPALRKFVESADFVMQLGVNVNDITTGGFSSAINETWSSNAYDGIARVHHRTYRDVWLPDLLSALERRALPKKRVPATLPNGWVRPVKMTGRLTTDMVAAALNEFIIPSDIVACDVGVAAHLAMDVKMRRATQFHIARLYVGMGFAMPAGIGAGLARGKGRPIILIGDGSFQMTGFDLSTGIREGLKPIVIVMDNHGYGAERSIKDGPFNDVSVWNYAAVAGVVGGKGTQVATGVELRDALSAARRDNRNSHIIQADLDPLDVPRALKALGKGLAALMNAK